MQNVDIRKVEDIDKLRRCLEIRKNVFIIEKGVPEEIEIDNHDCLNESCIHFLIRYNNRDAGTIRCLRISNDTVKIQRFCFLKECRGLGLGKMVVAFIEDYYKQKGFSSIEMDAKYEVFGFYEKCGYKKVSDVFMEAGIQHVKMKKEL